MAQTSFLVLRIEDPSEEVTLDGPDDRAPQLSPIRVPFEPDTTVEAFKSSVHDRTGISIRRQRYYAVASCYDNIYRFQTEPDVNEEIFLNDSDKVLLHWHSTGGVNLRCTVGLVTLPPPAGDAAGGGDERPPAGAAVRTRAIVPVRDNQRADYDGTDDSSPGTKERGEQWAGPRRRAARTDVRGGRRNSAPGGGGGALPARVVAADEEDEETDGSNDHNAGKSEILRWLLGLGPTTVTVGARRFGRYAPSFEREFASLEDLALAADEPGGLDSILRDCGVEARGDRARIRWAIGKLPRPH